MHSASRDETMFLFQQINITIEGEQPHNKTQSHNRLTECPLVLESKPTIAWR